MSRLWLEGLYHSEDKETRVEWEADNSMNIPFPSTKAWLVNGCVQQIQLFRSGSVSARCYWCILIDHPIATKAHGFAPQQLSLLNATIVAPQSTLHAMSDIQCFTFSNVYTSLHSKKQSSHWIMLIAHLLSRSVCKTHNAGSTVRSQYRLKKKVSYIIHNDWSVAEP